MSIGQIKLIALVMSLLPFIYRCDSGAEKKPEYTLSDIPAVNIDHLLYLYADVDLPNGQPGGIVHIYSEYPDYAYTIEPEEGYTCVDDVARAMMVDEIRFSRDPGIKEKYNRMAEFLLYMQSDNGFFYNFVWNDLSINKTYRTTLAEPNWWSWRAFWALSNFKSNDDSLQMRVEASARMLGEKILETYLDLPKAYDTIDGVVIPSWLPLKTAGDQAALLILGLEAYYQNIDKDPDILKMISKLADGLKATQKGDPRMFPFGAYLSWQNAWHAYGNNQAYAMLRAGQLLDRDDYIKSALLEIDYFYRYVRYEKYMSFFSIRYNGEKYEVTGLNHFPQIAYNFRPMIWALTEAFKVTRKESYLETAIETAQWFIGKNYAKAAIYDSATGRGYDGFNSPVEVNMNSGAESTIEALLALQVFDTLNDDAD
jgi:hypothetical protein